MTDENKPILATEIEAYDRLFDSLKSQEGKFAVIYGDKLLAVLDTYDDALAIGYKEAGLKPFLVKQISSMPFVANYTRDLVMATA